MRTVDLSYIFLTYNFIIGVLLIIASEKLGLIAGALLRLRRKGIARTTRVASTTFGSCLVTITLIVTVLGALE